MRTIWKISVKSLSTNWNSSKGIIWHWRLNWRDGKLLWRRYTLATSQRRKCRKISRSWKLSKKIYNCVKCRFRLTSTVCLKSMRNLRKIPMWEKRWSRPVNCSSMKSKIWSRSGSDKTVKKTSLRIVQTVERIRREASGLTKMKRSRRKSCLNLSWAIFTRTSNQLSRSITTKMKRISRSTVWRMSWNVLSLLSGGKIWCRMPSITRSKISRSSRMMIVATRGKNWVVTKLNQSLWLPIHINRACCRLKLSISRNNTLKIVLPSYRFSLSSMKVSSHSLKPHLKSTHCWSPKWRTQTSADKTSTQPFSNWSCSPPTKSAVSWTESRSTWTSSRKSWTTKKKSTKRW